MSRSRTLVLVSIAALLVIAALVALRMRSAEADPLDARQAVLPTNSGPERIDVSDSPRVGARAERSAIGGEEAPTAQLEPDSRTSARLTVELVAAGRPVHAGDVELHLREGEPEFHASVDAHDGCARFPDVPSGVYVVSLSNLPQGCLPPRSFRWHGNLEEEPGAVTVAGKDRTLRIELELSAHVFGSVRDPDGKLVGSEQLGGPDESSVSSVRVRLVCKNATTDEYADEVYCDVINGRFERELYSGLWLATVVGQPLDSPAQILAPLPALRQLMPGASTELTLPFRAPGTRELRGTIRDEEGKPFGGLRVSVFRVHSLVEPSTGQPLSEYGDVVHAQSAEADGSFVLQGLEAGRYRVYIEVEDPGHSKLGEFPESREVELSDAVTKFEYSIRRAHPVHIRGTVVVDAEWAKSHGVKGSLPSIEVAWATGREGVQDGRSGVRNDNGDFEYWLDVSLKDPRLLFTLAGEKLVYPLTLSAEGELAPITIRFPR